MSFENELPLPDYDGGPRDRLRDAAKAAEAAKPLPRWRAVIADRDGFVMADEQIELWCSGMAGEYARHYGDSEPRDLYVVTGEALPEPQSQRPDETFFRMPNPLTLNDVLYQADLYDEEPDEILRQWKRAVDTVAAMNAAGVQ